MEMLSMDESKIRQLFKNNSDCYADTASFDNNNNYVEGDVIMAMTEDKFVEIIKQYFDNSI